MENIDTITKVIALIIALFSFPKMLHSIHEHRRKKFKDEFENYKEYFEKFYKCKPTALSKLLRDKAAQNITRNLDMKANLLDYLIEMHEKDLVNFDKITDQYHWGNRFIDVQKNESGFIFSSKRKLSKVVSGLNYFLYAMFIIIAVFTFLGNISLFNIQWLDSLIGTAHIIFAIVCLRTADDMREALKFLATISNAEITQSTTNSLAQYNDQVDMAS